MNRCPLCNSTQVYWRVKSKSFLCQKCGESFEKEKKKEKELNLDAKNGLDIVK